jgi:hypothetical protein
LKATPPPPLWVCMPAHRSDHLTGVLTAWADTSPETGYFLVKYKSRPHLYDRWLSGARLATVSPIRLKNFLKKYFSEDTSAAYSRAQSAAMAAGGDDDADEGAADQEAGEVFFASMRDADRTLWATGVFPTLLRQWVSIDRVLDRHTKSHAPPLPLLFSLSDGLAARARC